MYIYGLIDLICLIDLFDSLSLFLSSTKPLILFILYGSIRGETDPILIQLYVFFFWGGEMSTGVSGDHSWFHLWPNDSWLLQSRQAPSVPLIERWCFLEGLRCAQRCNLSLEQA